MTQLKRILSFVLALVLTAGMLPPVSVRGEEMQTEVAAIEQTAPQETAPVMAAVDETVPEETVPEETVPEETVPEETVPEETVPEETVPEETVPEETVPEETVSEETIPEETVPEETVPEETVPEETVSEETFFWELDENGILTVTGEGMIPDYIDQSAPWADRADAVQQVVIGEGITSIGAHAFCGCAGLTQVTLSNSVTAVAQCALPVSEELNIEFDGTVEQWFALGTDLPAVCLQGQETVLTDEQMKNVTVVDENGNSMTMEELTLPQTAATFSRNRPVLPLPSNPQWHRFYTDRDTGSYKTRNGMISWYAPAGGKYRYDVSIFKKTDGEPIWVDKMFFSAPSGYACTDHFMKYTNLMKLPAGYYYFSITTISEDFRYSSSGSVTSGLYYFTGMPSKTLSIPTGIKWETLNNYPAFSWELPSDKSYLDGYEIVIDYSTTKTGTPQSSRSVSVRGIDYTSQPKGILQSTSPFKALGKGYYSFRIRALSSDPEKANNSKYSALSSRYYYDGSELDLGNAGLNPANYPEFLYEQDEMSQALALNYSKYSLLAYGETEIGKVGQYEDGNDDSLLADELQEAGFEDIYSYYFKSGDISGPITKKKTSDAGEHTSPFVIAHRKVNFNNNVVDQIMVVFLGTYKDEWLGNFDVTGTAYNDKTDMHYSFSKAADNAMSIIADYIKSMKDAKKVDPREMKITLTGHSRGAAVADIVATYLSDLRDDINSKVPSGTKFSTNNLDIGSVHAYTFAAPNQASVTRIKNKQYNNIFNFCLTDDFVPNLPLESWSWGKFGRTFWISGADVLKKNDNFMDYMELYYGKELSYNATYTKGIVQAMTEATKPEGSAGIRRYYENPLVIDIDVIFKETVDKKVIKLYEFARNGIGAYKAGNVFAGHIIKEPSGKNNEGTDPNLKKLSQNLVDGSGTTKPLNSAHYCTTYYYAMLSCFDEFAESELTDEGYDLTQYSFSRAGSDPADANAEQLAAVESFLRDGIRSEDGTVVLPNYEMLNWDINNPDTWKEGFVWDENGDLIEIDLQVTSITGTLDLSAFPNIQSVNLEFCNLRGLNVSNSKNLVSLNCSGNYLTELDLSGLENLVWLECANNLLTSLDLTGCTGLEKLVCNGNQLTELDLSACTQLTELLCIDNYLNEQSITLPSEAAVDVDADIQKVNPEAAFNDHDVQTLLAVAAANPEILNWNQDNPAEWAGVEWVAVDNVYYAKVVDLQDLKLQGTADFSGCTQLQSLLLSANDFTDLSVENCGNLTTLWCDRNYLDVSELESLAIENLRIEPQRFLAVLDENEVTALKDLFEVMGLYWEDEQLTINEGLVWQADENNVYHLTELNIPYGASQEAFLLDLSAFDRLRTFAVSDPHITEIIIPANVSNIKSGTFRGCESLQTIRFLGDAPQIADNAFVGITATVHHPAGAEGWEQHYGQTYGGEIEWAQRARITLSADKTDLLAGQKATLTAVFSDENAANTKLDWTVSAEDAQFLTIKPNGRTAEVTASTTTEKRTILVSAGAAGDSSAAGQAAITIYPKVQKLSVFLGDQDVTGQTVPVDCAAGLPTDLILAVSAAPDDIGALVNPLYTWKSASAKIADISADGKITFRASTGSVKFTATANDGSKATASVTLKLVKLPQNPVIKAGTVTELLSGKSATLAAADGDVTLTGKQITWSLAPGSEPYATVTAAGKITAKKVYQTVTVKVLGKIIDSNRVLEHTITIYPLATQAEISQGKAIFLDLTSGKAYADRKLISEDGLVLKAQLYPQDAKQDVTWSVKGSAATVDAEGRLIPKSAGTVTVTATAGDGSKKSAQTTVTVGTYIHSLQIDPVSQVLRSGDTAILTAAVDPADAQVIWSLANAADEKYAELTSDGQLRVKTVYDIHEIPVQAVSADGVLADTAVIRVEPAVNKLLAICREGRNITGEELVLNGQQILSAQVLTFPRNAQTVVWNSSDPSVVTVTDHGDNTATVTSVGTGSAVITASVGEGDDALSVAVDVRTGSFAQKLTIGSKTGTFTVASGKKLDLTAAVSPQNVKPKITWSLAAGDEAYASVSTKGALTAKTNLVRKVTVTVYAAAADGSGVTASETVTIMPVAQALVIRDQNAAVISGMTLTHDMGKDAKLKVSAGVYPAAADQTVTWSSSSSKVATVDDKGEITCVNPGTVTIKATAADGSKQNASFKLTVVKKVTDFALRDTVLGGGKKLTLSVLATGMNADATNKKLAWKVSGPGAAFVSLSSDVLTAKAVTGPKVVTVTATTTDDSALSRSCTVTVYPLTTKLSLYQQNTPVSGSLTMDVGEELKLTPRSTPYGAVQSFAWSHSSKGEVISVAPDGTIKALNPGDASLTVAAVDGSGKKISLKIKVIQKVEELTLPGEVKVAAGKSVTLTAGIAPANATNKKLKWEIVSGKQYATISSSGKFAAKKLTLEEPIPVTVQATCTDSGGKFATTVVWIVPVTASVTMYDVTGMPVTGSCAGYVGQTMRLYAQSRPEAAAQEYVWTVSNAKYAAFKTESGELVSSVTDYGVDLVPLTPGKSVTVTATAVDGSKQKASVRILTEARPAE